MQLEVVRPAGFEPATPALGKRCSIRLSYGRGGKKVSDSGPRWRVQDPSRSRIFWPAWRPDVAVSDRETPCR